MGLLHVWLHKGGARSFPSLNLDTQARVKMIRPFPTPFVIDGNAKYLYDIV